MAPQVQELRDELTALRNNKVEMEAEIQRLAAQITTGQPGNPVAVIHSQATMQALLHDLPLWQTENQPAAAAAAAAAAQAPAQPQPSTSQPSALVSSQPQSQPQSLAASEALAPPVSAAVPISAAAPVLAAPVAEVQAAVPMSE